MIRFAAMTVLLALAACAGSPPPPDWKMNAHGALENYRKHYLDGNGKLADLNFTKARAEAARTGQPDLIARIELARCGIRSAALEFDTCPDYLRFADSAAPAERQYAAFLAGDWQGLDGKSLPAQYGAILKSDGEPSLGDISDPVSRLIAAGVLFKAGRLSPAGIAIAIATASEQGWRRPLLAWLGVALKRAEAAGDREAMASLQRRIDLVTASHAP